MARMMMRGMKKMRKRRRRRMKALCGRELLKRRMKQIPRGRRQKMGRRHEPLPVGLGMGGPSGPGGGAGTHKYSPPSPGSLLWPCPRAVTLVLPPSLSSPSLQTLLLRPHCRRCSS
ncbi:enhancer of polycomb-like protein 1 isoform X1 [Cricetulus griseus]|uniref:enhancer of polycomb-like protein 1 isoform X1 n=1 Tax=Cricetulus griseus TaxID=10029 RepID=UPI000F749C60|nr:enhancer of polycomb-like protein 1 isoform X1 [Cricetulus griseus]